MWQKLFVSNLFVPTRTKKLTLKGLDNQDGQIAIFIALIFQVLFIFFAMLINVGLIVHDKINLQNSVDLAAYYGAERQAELLNEIAHINYQIRQEYKLLAWRQRILGTYAVTANANITSAAKDTDPEDFSPAVCVDHAGWSEIFKIDPTHTVQYCESPNASKPPTPTYNVVASFLSISGYLANYYDKVTQSVTRDCEAMGPLNWFTASTWLYEYKQSVFKRSEMIRAIAKNLSNPGKQFLDIKQDQVMQGVLRTYLKNLTEANLNSVSSKSNNAVDNPADFTFINSLSSDVAGGCSNIGADGNPNWIHENLISPQVTYVNSVSNGSACLFNIQYVSHVPYGAGMTAHYSSIQSILDALIRFDSSEPTPGTQRDSFGYSSLGFEKNPWCLAYVGVKATTRPRKPFAPFGQPVTLQARAFASPFGGRIGPWTFSQWPVGDPKSSGPSRLDPLTVPRTLDPGSPTADPNFAVPNYSKYPGDQLGLRSKLAHYLFGKSMLIGAFPGAPAGIHFPLSSYDQIMNPTNTDSLSQDSTTPGALGNTAGQPLRQLENAAIAPDLFDITYYSIDADFYGNYFNASTSTISDLGSNLSIPALKNWNVYVQMQQAKNKLVNLNVPGVNWLTPSLDYLLTGWTQGKTGDYTSQPAQFAQCQIHPNYADNWPPVPGFCVVGGRTGYSVRLMARKYLQSSSLELGGQGIKGKLQNSPPGGW